MDKDTIITLVTIVGSGFFVPLITGYFSRKKNGAETKNLTISGEISIGDAWMKYGKEWKEEAEKLKTYCDEVKKSNSDLNIRFDEMSLRFEVLKVEKEKLERENAEKDRRIKELENRVGELEKELARSKPLDKLVDTAKENIQHTVDENLNTLKQ